MVHVCDNQRMTDSTEQGYDALDVAAIGSTILGLAAIILTATMPYRMVGLALTASIAGIVLALATGAAARRAHRTIPMTARIGSIASVAAIVLLFVWEIARN